MLQRTKEEAMLRRKGDKTMRLIDGIQTDIDGKTRIAGANKEMVQNVEYTKPAEVPKDFLRDENVVENSTNKTIQPDENTTITPIVPEDTKRTSNRRNSRAKVTVSTSQNTDSNIAEQRVIPDDVQYDMIPLPSNGEAYPNKKKSLPVSYLTAADENVITSPNLYRDGTILDVLLDRKIMDNTINPDFLCKGDRDAIILWLRATGYGVEFPITVRDPKSGKEFDTTIDLTQIKTKPFTLKGDSEGYFDYETSIRKDKIKFKFFNRLDELELEEMENDDIKNSSKKRLAKIVKDLKDEIMNTDNLSDNDRNKLIACASTIESWEKNIPSVQTDGENHSITNSMELSIVEVNGNRDRDFIHKYVLSMPAKEALDFRKYIGKNEPGMDFKITVERPQSLGGGSFETFLKIDNTLFLNIA